MQPETTNEKLLIAAMFFLFVACMSWLPDLARY
jgi:hypothetical protein